MCVGVLSKIKNKKIVKKIPGNHFRHFQLFLQIPWQLPLHPARQNEGGENFIFGAFVSCDSTSKYK